MDCVQRIFSQVDGAISPETCIRELVERESWLELPVGNMYGRFIHVSHFL